MWYKSFPRLIKRLQPGNYKRYSQIPEERPDLPLAFDQPPYVRLCRAYSDNEELARGLLKTMTVHCDFLTPDEERALLDELEPHLRRMRYQFDHWDDAIHGYRETERSRWTEPNGRVIERVRAAAFAPPTAHLATVHVLDLDRDGHIKPHIDAVRFCGDTIAGLSLLTDSVMRLVHDKQPHLRADVLLKRRSLYVMTGAARYDYKHEILSNERSTFDGAAVFKDRRVSVICRNEPRPEDRL